MQAFSALGFGLLVDQKKQFKGVTVDSGNCDEHFSTTFDIL